MYTCGTCNIKQWYPSLWKSVFILGFILKQTVTIMHHKKLDVSIRYIYETYKHLSASSRS